MCHYARTDFQCGDWVWGNMEVRCPRQHRMGETCGAKLSEMNSIIRAERYCGICRQINVKQRRLQRVTNNLDRWIQEGDKLPALVEKAIRDAANLRTAIYDLHKKRTSFALSNKDSVARALVLPAAFRIYGSRCIGATTSPSSATTNLQVLAFSTESENAYGLSGRITIQRRTNTLILLGGTC
jgi:hypothetical protein